MARLIVAEQGRKRAVTLVGEQIVVGTGAEANLRLKDPEVGSTHCRIVQSGQSFILTPAGHPVFLNGKEAAHPEVLRHGDQIRIGDATLFFEAQAPAASPPSPPAPPRAQVRAQPAVEHRPRSHRPHRERHHEEKSPAGPILMGSLILIALLGGGWWVSKMAVSGTNPEEALAQARQLIADKRVDEAMGVLSNIERSAGSSYDEAQRLLRQYRSRREAKDEALQPPDPVAVYEQMVASYYEQFLKGHGADEADKARAYYFLEYRCKDYLKRFPGSEKVAAVTRMQEYFRDSIGSSRSFPETLSELTVLVEGENELNRFGVSYQAITDWLTLHGASVDVDDAKKLRDRCLEVTRKYVDGQKETARRRTQDLYFKSARRLIEDARANCQGIPGVTEDLAAELTRVEAAEKDASGA